MATNLPSRRLILIGGGALALVAAPLGWLALPEATRAAILATFGRAPVEDRRMSLKTHDALPDAPSEGFSQEVETAVAQTFGRSDAAPGPVTLTLPGLAENGYSVNLSVEVDTPISPEAFIRRIAIFSELNPVTTVAQFHLNGRSGRARVSTRIRLAGTQRVHAVAEHSDGSLWATSAQTIVTLAACVVD